MVKHTSSESSLARSNRKGREDGVYTHTDDRSMERHTLILQKNLHNSGLEASRTVELAYLSISHRDELENMSIKSGIQTFRLVDRDRHKKTLCEASRKEIFHLNTLIPRFRRWNQSIGVADQVIDPSESNAVLRF